MPNRRELARLRQAAEAGDMDAATELADMLMHEGDLSGAERWNRRAAEAGNHDGIVDLGIVLCMMGRFEEAEPWLRKGVADPRRAETPGYCEYVLGRCLGDLQKFDEAEQWLAIGADAGIEDAAELLERLRKYRASMGGARQGSGKDVLQRFEVSYVTFYDGSGHRLGPSRCTLTRTRLIIDDTRGGIHQVPLRDISGMSTPSRFGDPKTLRISLPMQAYDVTFKSKDQKHDFEAWLSEAIHGA